MSLFACYLGKTICSINTHTRRYPGKILKARSGLVEHKEFVNCKNKADAGPSAFVSQS